MVTASGDGGSSWVDRLDLTAGAYTLVIIAGQVRMAKSERRSLLQAWAYGENVARICGKDGQIQLSPFQLVLHLLAVIGSLS